MLLNQGAELCTLSVHGVTHILATNTVYFIYRIEKKKKKKNLAFVRATSHLIKCDKCDFN